MGFEATDKDAVQFAVGRPLRTEVVIEKVDSGGGSRLHGCMIGCGVAEFAPGVDHVLQAEVLEVVRHRSIPSRKPVHRTASR